MCAKVNIAMRALGPMLLLPGIRKPGPVCLLPDWRLALAFGLTVATATSTLDFSSFSVALGFEIPLWYLSHICDTLAMASAPRRARVTPCLGCWPKSKCPRHPSPPVQQVQPMLACWQADALMLQADAAHASLDRGKQHEEDPMRLWAKATVIACMKVMMGDEAGARRSTTALVKREGGEHL